MATKSRNLLPTDMTDAGFRRALAQASDWVAGYRERVSELPVLAQVRPGQVEASLPAAPPTHGEPVEQWLADLRLILPGVMLTLFDATVGRTPPESVVPSTTGSTGLVLFDRARAYLHVAAGMEVFDLGDPARPRSVATVPRLESVSEDVGFGRVEYDPVICSNPYTTCPPTAEVFDLEDPSSPSLVAAVVDYIGAFEGRTYQRHENCSEGSGTCWDWLLVKDWRDPSSPKRYVTGFDLDVQSMTMDPRAAVLRVWGFTQTWSLRYETLDLSDPDHPTRTAGWWGGTPRTFAHGREYYPSQHPSLLPGSPGVGQRIHGHLALLE